MAVRCRNRKSMYPPAPGKLLKNGEIMNAGVPKCMIERPQSAHRSNAKGEKAQLFIQQAMNEGRKQTNEEHENLLNEAEEINSWTANWDRNRQFDSLLYDHSRVILTPTVEKDTNYIHGSWVDFGRDGGLYICTQAPLAHTCMDFWRMVWQENVQLIVSLVDCNNSVELESLEYFPNKMKKTNKYGGGLLASRISVKCVDVKPIGNVPNFMQYTMKTTINEGKTRKDCREVQIMQFESWPDPDDGKQVDAKLVSHLIPPIWDAVAGARLTIKASPITTITHQPIVLQCIDGTGRAAPFAAILAGAHQLKTAGRTSPQLLAMTVMQSRASSFMSFLSYTALYWTLAEFERKQKKNMNDKEFQKFAMLL